jgi:ketosteroid isomerase-like protein
MGHPNEELVTRFYTAFSQGDTDGMIACYHDNVVFEDPAFGRLDSQQARAMWQLLGERAKGNLTVTFRDVHADDKKGSAHWEAVYPFSRTGRRVHNKIDASFEFQDGKIIRHIDRFSFWRWSSMALGPIGTLLGFTPMLHNKVMKQSRGLLADFMKRKA